MKTRKFIIVGTAGLFLLVIFCVGLLAASDDLSGKKAVAVDRTQTAEDRMGAIFDLEASADSSAALVLLRILRDESEDSQIRKSAVLALTTLGTPRTEIINAFKIAFNESNAGKNFRYTILHSLGKMKAVEAMSLLSTALSNNDSMTRLKAAQALGALQNENALQLLAAHLAKEEDYMIRAAAIRAVGQSQTTTAERILSKYLRSDSSPLVRNNAAIMLGKFTTRQSDTKAALQAAMEDESATVRETVRGIQP
jgi:HEAT repeat protein